MVDTVDAPRYPPWVNFLDAATCLLLALSSWAFLTGGVGLHGDIAGVRVSLTSELRLFLAAAVLAGVRHLFFRHPTLWQRVKPVVDRILALGAADPLPADAAMARAASLRVGALELLAVAASMAALTVLVTWPQVVRLDAVPDLGDPLFSIWRLKWFAHQIPRDPFHLFDANIFYPERYTLAFSDSILLPSLLAAPFLWLGAHDVAVYNGWVLLTFVFGGISMYALVRVLTGRVGAALVAATIFAFYPFRFEHYPHFELLFSFWTPLTLLGVHRMLARGRVRDGVLAGAAFGAQALSSLYFAIFLTAYGSVLGGAIALTLRNARSRLKPALAGVAIAAIMTAPLAWPYLQVRRIQGERGYGEMAYYSARGEQYLVAHRTSTTYYALLGGDHQSEKELFPGILVVALAAVALWPPLSATRIAYALALVFAFDCSLGTHGAFFPPLVEHVIPFRGLRVPARFSMFVGTTLAILAGFGTARLTQSLRRPWLRATAAGLLCAIVLFESRPTLPFVPVPAPHNIYRWFDGRPASVIAELPTPGKIIDTLTLDVRYSYPATFHWQRMLNGNSGHYPMSYIRFSGAMQTFPDAPSVAMLHQRGVDYVLLHEEYYGKGRYAEVVGEVRDHPELSEVARETDRGFEVRIYRLMK